MTKFRNFGSLQERCVIKYSSGIPNDIKPLSRRSGNGAKILLKTHLGIKCHPQHIIVIILIQPSPNKSNVNWDNWGCTVRDLELICKMKFICTILASWPLYNVLCNVWDTNKKPSQVPRQIRSARCVVGRDYFVLLTRRKNTIDNDIFNEICR